MTREFVPPHDALAEQSLLASLLARPDDLADALDLVTAADFYGRKHQQLFQAIVDVDASGTPVDLVSVHKVLRERGSDRDVPSEYLAELSGVPVGSVAYRARVIRDRAKQRAMLHELASLEGQGRDESTDPVQWLSTVQERILGMAEDAAPTKPEDILETAHAAMALLDERSRGQLDYVPTVLAPLNWLIHGWEPGFHVLAANPGLGKTSLALQEVVNFASQDRTAFVCSCEMERHVLMLALLSQLSGVNNERLVDGKLTGQDWSLLANAADRIGRLPIAIMDDSAPTVADLRVKYRREMLRLKRKHPDAKPGIIVVDYLQLMRGHGGTREEEVASISRGLREIAKDFGVVVLALSQLNRTSAREGRAPRLSDLRESGQIEQDAKKVVFIWNPNSGEDGHEGDRQLIVAKARGGGRCGKADVVFHGPTTLFTTPTHESHDDCDYFDNEPPQHWND